MRNLLLVAVIDVRLQREGIGRRIDGDRAADRAAREIVVAPGRAAQAGHGVGIGPGIQQRGGSAIQGVGRFIAEEAGLIERRPPGALGEASGRQRQGSAGLSHLDDGGDVAELSRRGRLACLVADDELLAMLVAVHADEGGQKGGVGSVGRGGVGCSQLHRQGGDLEGPRNRAAGQHVVGRLGPGQAGDGVGAVAGIGILAEDQARGVLGEFRRRIIDRLGGLVVDLDRHAHSVAVDQARRGDQRPVAEPVPRETDRPIPVTQQGEIVVQRAVQNGRVEIGLRFAVIDPGQGQGPGGDGDILRAGDGDRIVVQLGPAEAEAVIGIGPHVGLGEVHGGGAGARRQGVAVDQARRARR